MKRNRGKHTNKSKKINKMFFIFLFTICIICISISIYNKIVSRANQTFYENIIVKNESITETVTNITQNMQKVIDLKQENEDVIGWIQIDNTIIDYPVLQTFNNDYYLTHNYKKEKSKYGSIYVKDKCNIQNSNSNIIIYGHNMKDEQMFNTLLKYKDKNFYNDHKIIKIATDKEEIEYEIISVFKSRIFYQDEKDVFRYYNYTEFEDEKTYNKYIDNCKKIQLYDTGISAEYGEQLITLVTCEYSEENGRMVVVAKRRRF